MPKVLAKPVGSATVAATCKSIPEALIALEIAPAAVSLVSPDRPNDALRFEMLGFVDDPVTVSEISYGPRSGTIVTGMSGTIFAAAWALEGLEGLITTSEVLFWVLVFLWGTRKAAGAFESEVANNTWDSQRLSALTAVQIFGGAGYMRETRVEQLMRDAKILQIYAGTDEMQIVAIAKDLLGRACRSALADINRHQHIFQRGFPR